MSTIESGRESAPVRAPRDGAIRAVIHRLHFYAGIFVAPFILLAALSGGLYALAPTIEQIVYRDQLHTDSTGPALPVAEQIRAAGQTRPDLTVSAVRPAAAPGQTTRVLFTDPDLGPSERLAVFVDPVTAEPLGELTVYGSAAALPVRAWISQFHRHLHLGEPGRLYSEAAASWMWVLALGGLYLWWRRYRTARTRGADASLLVVDRRATGRARTLGRHATVGLWITVGLLFLSATGLTWSKYAGENIGDLRAALGWGTPAVSTSLTGAAPAPAAGHGHHGGHAPSTGDPAVLDGAIAAVDAAVATAAAHGLTGVLEVSLPHAADTAMVVAETRQPWVYGIDSVAVDPRTGEVTDVLRFADWSVAAKLTWWSITLHMGILFGLVSQLALALLAAALITVIVHGYLMWWQRRPARGTSRPSVGRPPARGAARRLGALPLVLLAVVTVAVGIAVPVLGVSLLGFLIVDALVGRRASR